MTEPQGPATGMATGVVPDGMPCKGAVMVGAAAGARTGARMGARTGASLGARLGASASIRPGASAGASAGSRLASSRRIWTMLSIISCGIAIEAESCQRKSIDLARAVPGPAVDLLPAAQP